jgi:hypothetical protein
MKKLLVVALSAMLVLGMATVSMAAVTITGEIDSTLDLTTDTASTTNGNLVFAAAINDDVSATARVNFGGAVASSDISTMDNYSVTVKLGTGSLQAGYCDLGTGGKFDVIASQAGNVGKQVTGPNVIYSMPIGDAIKVKVAYDYAAGDMGFDIGYAAEKFGVDLVYVSPSVGDATDALNGYYNVSDALVVYGQYAITPVNVDAQLGIGAKYTADWGFGELEYGYDATGVQETVIKVGYNVKPNAALVLKSVSPDGGDAANSLTLAVTF